MWRAIWCAMTATGIITLINPIGIVKLVLSPVTCIKDHRLQMLGLLLLLEIINSDGRTMSGTRLASFPSFPGGPACDAWHNAVKRF